MSDVQPEGSEKPVLPAGAGPFERHVFVCGPAAVRVNKSGCLGQCGHGPVICVYPENVWYAGVRIEDVPEIVASHLAAGVPVDRLLFRGHHAGPNVVRPPDPV